MLALHRKSAALLLSLSLTTLIPTAHAELDDGYGVLIGKPFNHGLEPPNQGQWPHYKLWVQTPAGNYEVAVNLFAVTNNNGVAVAHREMFMDPAYSSYYNSIFGKADGWHALPFHTQAGAAGGGALDFVRHRGVVGDISDFAWQQTPLIVDADNNPNTQNAVPAFDNLLAGAKRVYIWGEPFDPPGKGVHNVHQNQGNTSGSFLAANGIWQDGGMVIERDPIIINGVCVRYPCPFPIIIPNRTLVMTRFQVQADFTNSAGTGITNPIQFTANGSATNGWVYYGPFNNASQLQVDLSNVVGDPDAYVRVMSQPTTSAYNKRSSSAAGQPVFLREYQPGPVAPQWVGVYANGAASWSIKVRQAP